MAGIPKRIREQMQRDGVSVEDLNNEIQNEHGDFGDLLMDPEDAATLDELDTQTTLPEEVVPEEIVDDVEEASEEVLEETTEETVEGEPASASTVNPYDVGLEPESPTPVPDPEREELRGEVRSLREQLAALRQPSVENPPVVEAEPALETVLTPDEIVALGGSEHVAVFERALKRVTDTQNAQLVRLQSRMAEIDTQTGENLDNSFVRSVKNQVPDFDQIVASRSWKGYVQEYNPLAGGTVADAIRRAQMAHDEKAMVGIFNVFMDRFDAPRPKPTSKPSAKLKSLAVPSKTGASKPPRKPKSKHDFKGSDIERWDALRRSKKMSGEEYTDKVLQFEKALSEGRVDENN